MAPAMKILIKIDIDIISTGNTFIRAKYFQTFSRITVVHVHVKHFFFSNLYKMLK